MQTKTTSQLTSSALRKAADLKAQIEDLTSELEALLGGSASAPRAKAGRPAKGKPAGKRVMSEEAKAKIAAAAVARWKKAKAAGRNRL